jgi:hypothetical protein
VTGGPVSTPPRFEPTENGRFATRNATARGRYRAYWRRPVLGTVPSWERPVVADCGDLYQNGLARPAGSPVPVCSVKGHNGGGGGGDGGGGIDWAGFRWRIDWPSGKHATRIPLATTTRGPSRSHSQSKSHPVGQP